MHFKSVNSQSPPTVICKSVTVHTQHLLQTLRHIQPDVTGQGQGKEASGKMRGGQGTEDYTLLYMFLQWPVYLFCVIYNSPQSLKDLTLLCKQNVVSEMVKWTVGYGDASKHRKLTSDKDGARRCERRPSRFLGAGHQKTEKTGKAHHASQQELRGERSHQCLKGRRRILTEG